MHAATSMGGCEGLSGDGEGEDEDERVCEHCERCKERTAGVESEG